MRSAKPLPQLLTIDQLAEHLGVTPRHVRRLVAERRVPSVRVGRFVRFDPPEIAAWLDSNRVPGRRASGTRPSQSVTTMLPGVAGPALSAGLLGQGVHGEHVTRPTRTAGR